MKLEIKHLAPYLQHQLQVQYTQYGSLGISYGETILESLSDECATFKDCHDYYFDGFEDDEIEIDFKPLLRPLSDLTKEIEHNGEKIVPISIIRGYFTQIDGNHRDFDYPLTLDGLDCGVMSLPYWVVEKLHSWHFDTEGLIENNLAIAK